MRALNTLQTNAGYLEQVKRQRGDPQAQLEAMKLYLARSGLQVRMRRACDGPLPHPHPLSRSLVAEMVVCMSQVEDLDQLNIIHVTGTKGKVRDGTQGSGIYLMGW